MNKPFLRWGILGAANIARKNWKAIRNSGNGVVKAVASRELVRSQSFIADCQMHTPFEEAPRAEGSYEELISADDIDALYIPLPTGIRKDWVMRAAAAGKHVVCEKPCAVTAIDLAEMIKTCQEHRVQFMDGVMFMHSRRLDLIRQVLADPHTVGPIKRIHSVFNFSVPEEFFASNIRVQNELEPHGCLGDLGWYCIRFVLWAMDWRMPERVSGRILSETNNRDGRSPVSTEFSGELFFSGGVSADFYCSFITDLHQFVNLSGARGSLQIRDFVLPFAGEELTFETQSPAHRVQACDFDLQPNLRRWSIDEHSHSHASAQETGLFRHFADQVLSGTLNPLWPEMALKTQQVMEACRNSAQAIGRLVTMAPGSS